MYSSKRNFNFFLSKQLNQFFAKKLAYYVTWVCVFIDYVVFLK